MSITPKLLPTSWRSKLRPGLSPLLPFLLALDQEERREANNNKQSIIKKYKTLSWSHLNFSFLSDLLELKLANDFTGEDCPLFVSILGGSKTGKSFVFNHLLKQQLAPSGVGTTTHSMLLYLHKRWSWERLRDLYFPRPAPGLTPLENKGALCDSLTHRVFFLEHDEEGFSDFVLIDTPDFNREDDDNVRLAYMALALSDVILYVFTGETYADAGGTAVARLAHQCGKTIIPVYNMVDESLLDQPSKLIGDFQHKTINSQQHEDGSVSPPPYPFFPDSFFVVSWLDLRRDPKASARIEPVNFSSATSCLEVLKGWEQNTKPRSHALIKTLTKTGELLDTLTPNLEKVFSQLDRISNELSRIGESFEVEFPLPEAARAIYEVMEGFRPEAVNRFLSGVDKVHEKTIRLAIEWIRKSIARDGLTTKSDEDLSERRLRQESRRIVEGCGSFADSIRRSSQEYGLFLYKTLKLSDIDSQRVESLVYQALKKEDALAEVKQEMAEDMSQKPAKGLLVYSDIAMRISVVAGAIILTGDGVWVDNLLWGTLGEIIGQPLAKMFIGRVGGTKLLERYKARRRQRYQKIIQEIVLPDTITVLQNLPNRASLETVRHLLTEMNDASSHLAK